MFRRSKEARADKVDPKREKEGLRESEIVNSDDPEIAEGSEVKKKRSSMASRLEGYTDWLQHLDHI